MNVSRELKSNKFVMKNYLLALETAVRGGSIALFKDNLYICGWKGQSKISKSEDILEEIKKLLYINNVDMKFIKQIVFSQGPGSFTGIRIGIATALGLSKSLNIEMAGINLLETFLIEINENITTIAAIPFGKNQVIWQKFEKRNNRVIKNLYGNDKEFKAQISEITTFIEKLKNESVKTIILHEYLSDRISDFKFMQSSESFQIVNTPENDAKMLGNYFLQTKDELANVPPASPIYAWNH